MYDIDDMYHYMIAIVLRCYNAASFPQALLISFILIESMMGLLICKYEPF